MRELGLMDVIIRVDGEISKTREGRTKSGKGSNSSSVEVLE